MISWMHMLKGYVRWEAQGGMPQRLMELAAQSGVELWDTSREGISLFACCSAADYPRLRPLARRSGMRMHLCKRYGVPFWLRPLRWRWGLVAGVVAAAILLMGLSSRIWVITIQGNAQVPDTAILQALEPLGIRLGGTFDTVDIAELQLRALQELPELSWLTVNQKGSTLTVLVQEKQPFEAVEEKAPANVTAVCDGVIVEIEVTNGRAAVKVGDAVTKGSLLISGVTDSKVGPLLRRASGRVLARTVVTITEETPYCETRICESGEVVTCPSLCLFGVTIPLYTDGHFSENYIMTQTSYPLYAEDKPLPIAWQVQRWEAQRTELVEHSKKEAADLAQERLAKQAEIQLIGMTVESCEIRQEEYAQGVRVTGVYTVVREIGKTESISTK